MKLMYLSLRKRKMKSRGNCCEDMRLPKLQSIYLAKGLNVAKDFRQSCFHWDYQNA